MLTQPERTGITDEMGVQMLQAGPGVGALIYRWIGLHGMRVATNAVFAIWAYNVLRYCERFGWIEDPPPLLVLLKGLAEAPRTPFGAQIPTVAARIKAQQPVVFWSGSHAWDTCHLSLELPFLNRDTTRVAFQHFDNPLELSPRAARVLVVNGPFGSGKTFTASFLRLLVGLSPDQYALAELDFLTWTGGLLTPEALVVHLAQQMGTPTARAEAEVPRLGTQRDERWAKELAIWLAAEATRTQKTWHIVLDNFDSPGVPERTHLFIEQFLAGLAGRPLEWNIMDQSMGPPLRLVLLGYTRRLPEQNDLVRVETIQPITRADFATHFKRFYAFRGWPVSAAELDAIAARYEPYLPTLLPQAAPAAPGTPLAAQEWNMRKLAELVLLDCREQERLRNAAAGAGSAPAGPVGPAGGSGNG